MAQDAASSTRPTWWVVLLAVLAGGMIWGRLPGTGQRQAATGGNPAIGGASGAAGQVAEASDEGKVQQRLVRPLAEFFGNMRLGEAQVAELVRSRGHRVEFLVVTVADPVDSAISYSFDLQLDTLHRAMAAEDFIPDAFSIPWDRTDAKDPRWRREPGVLLFRRSWGSGSTTGPDLLLVLLVGEQPTTGVHQAALRQCVQFIGRLRELRPPGGSDQVMIAAPTFTGSAPSLAQAIRDAQADVAAGRGGWPAKTELSFVVITGAALGIDTDEFKKRAGHEGSTIELGATVGHVAPLKRALIDYVCERSIVRFHKPRIAWLTESVTGFGAASRAPDGGPLILELPFLVNIARVRATYEEMRSQQAAKGFRVPDDRYRLGLPFDDVQEARDLPRLFTPRITAPTNELVLGQIVELIRREGIQYVGISASDIRDPIFLAQILRQQIPEVQILLVTSDLVHLHPSYQRAMRGALVASSYPYFPDAQNWCYPRDGSQRRIVLSNQELFGLYNAIRLLRRRQDAPAGSMPRLPNPQPVDSHTRLLVYGSPLADKQPSAEAPLRYYPPVWISMIGASGIWPLETRPYVEDEQYAGYVVQVLPAESGDWNRASEHAAHDHQGARREHREHRSVHFTPMSYASQMTWAVFGVILAAAAAGRLPVAGLGALVFDQTRSRRHHVWFRWALGFFLAFLSLLLLVHSYLTISSLVVCGRDGEGLFQELFVHWRETGCVVLSSLAMALVFAALCSIVGLGARRVSLRAVLIGAAIQVLVLAIFAACAMRRDVGDLLIWTQYMTEEFNGVSPLLSLKLTLLAALALVFAVLKQLYLLRTEFHSRPSRDPAHGEPPAETQRRLLFPVWQRYVRSSRAIHRERPQAAAQATAWRRGAGPVLQEAGTFLVAVFMPLGAAIVIVVLLGWLGWMTTVADASWLVLRITVGLLLAACAYWSLGLIRLMELVNQFSTQMERLYIQLGGENPREAWLRVLGDRSGDELAGLHRFFSPRPRHEPAHARKLAEELTALAPASGTLTYAQQARRRELEEQLFAVRVELFAYQYFAHLRRLVFWLLVTSGLLYAAAASYPFNTAGWFRLLTSTMIAALGAAIVWGYVRLDRNELLSLISGTTPHRLHWDWALVARLAAVLLLAALALVGTAFPELWQWLSMVSEPLIVPMQ
jgi:hypothetical protein